MLLEVDDINTYRGPAHILRGVSINVDTDEVAALVGRNGAGRTTIIVTHRFTTAMRADVIHVMEQGRIVESGSHADLLAAGGRYAFSWARQSGEPTSPDAGPSRGILQPTLQLSSIS